MCELMGLSFDRAIFADFSIRAFGNRDEENPDGWGIAWYPDQAVALVKEALTWRKSNYARFLESYKELQSRIYLAHVRKQSKGIASYANTHPFVREYLGRDWCFAHNGTIENYEDLSLQQFRPIGTTDSERIFCHLLGEIAQHEDGLEDETAWMALMTRLRQINSGGKLNCLLSDGRRLFAYRDCNGWKGLSIRTVQFREGGQVTLEDEITEVSVEVDDANRGCVIATHPLTKLGWEELPFGSLTVLEGGTIRFSQEA